MELGQIESVDALARGESVSLNELQLSTKDSTLSEQLAENGVLLPKAKPEKKRKARNKSRTNPLVARLTQEGIRRIDDIYTVMHCPSLSDAEINKFIERNLCDPTLLEARLFRANYYKVKDTREIGKIFKSVIAEQLYYTHPEMFKDNV